MNPNTAPIAGAEKSTPSPAGPTLKDVAGEDGQQRTEVADGGEAEVGDVQSEEDAPRPYEPHSVEDHAQGNAASSTFGLAGRSDEGGHDCRRYEEEGVDDVGCATTQGLKHQAAEQRAEEEGDLLQAAVQGHSVHQVGRGHQLGHQGIAGRPLRDVYEGGDAGKPEDVPDLQVVGQEKGANGQRRNHAEGVHGHQHLAPVEDVCQRASEEAQGERGITWKMPVKPTSSADSERS